ncbi:MULTISPECIES: LysR substrate-binding domain-containing protein [unclassified Agarivorans]|uniref:LysR substrate-binding domain-containing protein n=1 Tax=unclassified Agarivorans TaxID=2636026 RepID=UPI003D7DCFF4
MLEIKHLRSLQALASSPSMKSAAAKLFVSESALSHQLKGLEQKLGVHLLLRKRQAIQLTEPGKQVLALAEQVLPLIGQLEQTLISGNQHSSRLNISVDCHACFQWLLPSLQQFKQAWPEVVSNLCQDLNYDGLPLLQQGETDLLLTSQVSPQEDIHYQPLFEYEMVIICPLTHPLSSKTELSAADLCPHTLISYPVNPQRLDIYNFVLTPENLQMKHRKHADNPAMLVQMVAADMGIAAMPYWAVDHYVKQRLICALPLQQALWRPMYAAYPLSLRNAPALQAFLQLLQQQTCKLLPGIRTVRVMSKKYNQ